MSHLQPSGRDENGLTEEERRLLKKLLAQVDTLNEMVEAHRMKRALLAGLRMAVIALGMIVASLAALDQLLGRLKQWLGGQ